MSKFLFPAQWPVRARLRPKPRRRAVTAADVDPALPEAFPDAVDELNLCCCDVWEGPGRPGRGWHGWTVEHLPLDEALDLSVEGEA